MMPNQKEKFWDRLGSLLMPVPMIGILLTAMADSYWLKIVGIAAALVGLGLQILSMRMGFKHWQARMKNTFGNDE